LGVLLDGRRFLHPALRPDHGNEMVEKAYDELRVGPRGLFRDSDSPRMLAYSTRDHVLYATDGCNACTRRVETQLERLPSEELREFAVENGIPPDLLQALVSHFTDSL